MFSIGAGWTIVFENDGLADLPKEWFKPTDAGCRAWTTHRCALRRIPRGRAEIWTQLPFNPQDPLVDSERMESLAFDASRISFESGDAMGATLRGLQKAIDDLS